MERAPELGEDLVSFHPTGVRVDTRGLEGWTAFPLIDDGRSSGAAVRLADPGATTTSWPPVGHQPTRGGGEIVSWGGLVVMEIDPWSPITAWDPSPPIDVPGGYETIEPGRPPPAFVPTREQGCQTGTPFVPPAFADAAPETQQCFQDVYGPGLTDWPPTECGLPCIEVRSDCEPVPSEEAMAAAESIPIVALSEEQLQKAGKFGRIDYSCIGYDKYGNTTFDARNRDWVPLYRDPTVEETAFVKAALALLLDNIGVVEWALCQAHSWSPNFPDPAEVDSQVRCVTEFLTNGGYAVYLIDHFPESCEDGGPGALGSATNDFSMGGGFGDIPNPGPVMPIAASYWVEARNAYEAGGANGLCALIQLASSLLHETVHVCQKDTIASGECTGSDCCWEEQRMAQTMFQEAMSQPYPCLLDRDLAPDCTIGEDDDFAKSSDKYRAFA
jgi:hypothetical protein